MSILCFGFVNVFVLRKQNKREENFDKRSHVFLKELRHACVCNRFNDFMFI